MAGVTLFLKSLFARRRAVVALATGLLVLSAAAAGAASVSQLGVAKRRVKGKSMTIVVDGRGVTVYQLGGESLAHLQCVTRQCLNLWPPLKVSSKNARVKKAAAVPGRLTIMTRVKGGFFQVMLDNHPLYYYSGDKGKAGSTKGQGINSFGGSWHVVKATVNSKSG
jgi:predicted lipoprotein with Yx(FWY)xxD motif